MREAGYHRLRTPQVPGTLRTPCTGTPDTQDTTQNTPDTDTPGTQDTTGTQDTST